MNEGRSEVDVLVVGAGPTGLTLGCDLARRGVRVRVVDKTSAPASGSRGKGLQPRTLEVFEDLGVVADVLAAGCPYPPMRVHRGPLAFRRELLGRSGASPSVPYAQAWLLPQTRTEAILGTRLASLGIIVDRDATLTQLAQDADGVTATLARPGRSEHVRARYLVGADGAHSDVRTLLNIPLRGAALEGPAMIVGDVHVDGLDRRYYHAWPWSKDGVIALCPLPKSALCQLTLQVRDPARALPLDEATVRALLERALGKRAPAIYEPVWLSLYRPSARMVERYRMGRVLLAGDAAHVHPPSGGHGLNLGVQDAYNLGWKLAAVLAGTDDTLLDTYEEERAPVAADVLGLARAAGRKQRRRDEAKQLATSYAGCSLAVSLRPHEGRLKAGDRAPDALCSDERGARVRLFELLRGTALTLLAFGTTATETARVACAGTSVRVYEVVRRSASARPGTLRDHEGHLTRAYDVGDQTIVLVRPDGYVGLVARAPSLAEIRGYLARVSATAHGADAPSFRHAG